MKTIGIDLGTTNTVAAVGNRVLSIYEKRESSLPSVVAFLPNGTLQTGVAARRRRSIDGANTVFSSKRIIGRRFSDSRTQEFRSRYPIEVVDAGSDVPAFQTRAGLHTPTEVAAILLAEIYQRVEPIADALDLVITVPTGFVAAQREATMAAASKAGFERMRLIDEPTATARAYLSRMDGADRVAVYDLGGGTFDFSILDCRGEQPQVLSRASDPFLGGDDIDHQIAEWAAREVLKQHNWDLANYSEVSVRLLVECERAKIRLSDEEETRIDLSQVDPECPAAAEGLALRREVMDELSSQLVRRTFVTCDDALNDAGLRASDLDAVLLAGGSTYLTAVQQGVEIYFGRSGFLDVNPTEVVACGASLSDPSDG
jgi:molecular chaperone DnaK